MNMFFLLFVYFLLFVWLSYKNFRLAVGLFIIFLPTYLIRFSLGYLPSTVLELSFMALVLVWLIKYAKSDWLLIKEIVFNYRWLFVLIGLFWLVSIIGIFVSGDYFNAAGLWRAYFLEPIILFFILLGRDKQINNQDLVLFLILSTLSISILAIIQKFTGWAIATPEWTNLATRRVTSFFSSPNAVGLYLAPIVVLMINFLISQSNKNKASKYVCWLSLVISLLALLFTKSEGAWIGLAGGLMVFIFLLGYRKITTLIIAISLFFIVLTPNLRQAVSFQDQASYNRLLLWSYTWNYLVKSPTNFVFGSGLRQFYDKIQKPVHDWSKIERHIYPHNIFLNFWTELGLLGLFSFIGLMGYLVYLANQIRQEQVFFGSGLMAMLVVFLIHGLVDVPYFKNDLAFLFWLIVGLIILTSQTVLTKVSRS